MSKVGARGLACVALALACSESTPARTPAEDGAVEPAPAPADTSDTPSGPAPATTCGTAGKTFETLDWIPPDAEEFEGMTTLDFQWSTANRATPNPPTD